jgi:pyrimidine-nucleoside phosphorylase
MISGRGLGITGGTLDKLESIPSFSTELSAEQFVAQVQSIGVAMGGQTSEIAPADQRLYALRDATGTVPSIPLITASILSKKLAEGLDALVMDVKYGSAAFMRERDEAKTLAETIVALATECGVECRALLTSMNTPLGRAAGNWLEVKEAIACLEGRGPADLEEVSIACVANLPNGDADKAREELASGRPREKFNELIASQGADLKAFESKLSKEVTAPVVRELQAEQDGFVHSCDARIIGELVRDLGGGRQKKDDLIRFDVGIDLLAKPGDHVEEGGVLARVHVDCESDVQSALNQLTKAFEISVDPPVLDGLIEQLAP